MSSQAGLQAGQIYAFPLRHLTPPYAPTGMFAVCRVARLDKDGAILAALDWGGDTIPGLEGVDRPVLRLSQGPYVGQPAIHWRAEMVTPDEFEYLGQSSASTEELDLIRCKYTTRFCTCKRIQGGWMACRAALNCEWRKRTDQTGFAADQAWLFEQMKAAHQNNR